LHCLRPPSRLSVQKSFGIKGEPCL
jgi:hypothetical protein